MDFKDDQFWYHLLLLTVTFSLIEINICIEIKQISIKRQTFKCGFKKLISDMNAEPNKW